MRFIMVKRQKSKALILNLLTNKKKRSKIEFINFYLG